MTSKQLDELQEARRQLRQRQWKCPNARSGFYCYKACKDCKDHFALTVKKRKLLKS